MIRIAEFARRIFKNTRLEVLPAAAIAIFIEDRRIVVFDHRDNVAVLDVPHPKVVELSVLVKPTAKNPDPVERLEPNENERNDDVTYNDPSTEDPEDGLGW